MQITGKDVDLNSPLEIRSALDKIRRRLNGHGKGGKLENRTMNT